MASSSSASTSFSLNCALASSSSQESLHHLTTDPPPCSSTASTSYKETSLSRRGLHEPSSTSNYITTNGHTDPCPYPDFQPVHCLTYHRSIACDLCGLAWTNTSYCHSDDVGGLTQVPECHHNLCTYHASAYPSPPSTNSHLKRNVPLPGESPCNLSTLSIRWHCLPHYFGGVLDSPVVMPRETHAYLPLSPPPTQPTTTQSLPDADFSFLARDGGDPLFSPQCHPIVLQYSADSLLCEESSKDSNAIVRSQPLSPLSPEWSTSSSTFPSDPILLSSSPSIIEDSEKSPFDNSSFADHITIYSRVHSPPNSPPDSAAGLPSDFNTFSTHADSSHEGYGSTASHHNNWSMWYQTDTLSSPSISPLSASVTLASNLYPGSPDSTDTDFSYSNEDANHPYDDFHDSWRMDVSEAKQGLFSPHFDVLDLGDPDVDILYEDDATRYPYPSSPNRSTPLSHEDLNDNISMEPMYDEESSTPLSPPQSPHSGQISLPDFDDMELDFGASPSGVPPSSPSRRSFKSLPDGPPNLLSLPGVDTDDELLPTELSLPMSYPEPPFLVPSSPSRSLLLIDDPNDVPPPRSPSPENFDLDLDESSDPNLRKLSDLRKKSIAAERAARQMEAQMLEQGAVHMRAEARRVRKKEKEKSREIGALLRLKLSEMGHSPKAMECDENGKTGSSPRKMITSMAQLVARMMFRRHDTFRPLANRKAPSNPRDYVNSPLARYGELQREDSL